MKRNRSRILINLAVVATTIFSLVGCSTATTPQPQSTQNNNAIESAERSQGATREKDRRGNLQKPEISMEQAIETAVKKQPGRVTAIELEQNHALQYEVEVLAEQTTYDLRIDATTGEVTKVTDDGDDPEDRKKSQAAKTNIVDAITTARKEKDGLPVSAELDYKKGQLVYEVEIRMGKNDKYEVLVDAGSGKVLHVVAD